MADVLRCKGFVATTGLQTIVSAPADGEVIRVDLDCTNGSGAVAGAYVYVKDNTDPANSHYKRNPLAVPPYPDPDSCVILLYSFFLSPGQELQVKATAPAALTFSAEATKGDASA